MRHDFCFHYKVIGWTAVWTLCDVMRKKNIAINVESPRFPFILLSLRKFGAREETNAGVMLDPLSTKHTFFNAKVVNTL